MAGESTFMFAIDRGDEEIEVEISAFVTIVKGSYSHNAPSDLDYYGYTEVDDIVAKHHGVVIELTHDEIDRAKDEAVELAEDESIY